MTADRIPTEPETIAEQHAAYHLRAVNALTEIGLDLTRLIQQRIAERRQIIRTALQVA